MLCLGFLRTVDRACMRWVSGEVCPPAWVPPLPVLRTLEGKGGGRLGLDSPDSVFGYWLPFLNVFVMTSAPGLLAAHPAGQARGAQAGVVGRMVSGLLSVQALALRGRPLVRPGVSLGSGSRSRGQVPGWEMTAVRPGGAGCRCSRGSAWASPLVPRDTLLLERLQSHVPGRDLQAPRRSCVLVVSREQEALAGQSGIPESQIPPPGSGVSEVHREAAARPWPHLHLHGTKCATSLAPPQSATSIPWKEASQDTHPCGPQWECPHLGKSRVLSSSGAIPGYDLSGVSFRKKQSPDPGLCPCAHH